MVEMCPVIYKAYINSASIKMPTRIYTYTPSSYIPLSFFLFYIFFFYNIYSIRPRATLDLIVIARGIYILSLVVTLVKLHIEHNYCTYTSEKETSNHTCHAYPQFQLV